MPKGRSRSARHRPDSSSSARSWSALQSSGSPADLPAYKAAIEELGLEIKPPRPRVDGEGQSLYFYDFDGHLLELHTGTLEERLARYSQG